MSTQLRKGEMVGALQADFLRPAMLLIGGPLVAGAGGLASFDFPSIPDGFSKLILDLYARGDTNAAYVVLKLKCNNDGGANYYAQESGQYNLTTVSGMQTVGGTDMSAGYVAALTAPASVFDGWVFEFVDYANTGGYKPIVGRGTLRTSNAATGIQEHRLSGWYQSTNAINQITLTCNAGNFAQYSKARLYGVY